MTQHLSLYGTTCWVCGHAGTESKAFEEGRRRVCRDCKRFPGGIEETRQARDATLRAFIAGADRPPNRYWSLGVWQLQERDFVGWPREFARELLCQPWSDAWAEATRARIRKAERAYHKEYYAGLRAERWRRRGESANGMLDELKLMEAGDGE